MMNSEAGASTWFLDPTSVNKHAKSSGVEGVFFKDDFGNRCVWGKVIKDHSKEQTEKNYRKKHTDFESRLKFMPLKKPLSLAQIDEPRSSRYWEALGCLSGKGCSLPENGRHRPHLLNLPYEILEQILKCILIAPEGVSIFPHTLTTNSKSHSEFFSYTGFYSIRQYPEEKYIDNDSELTWGSLDISSPLYTWKQKEDKKGKYFEMRKTYRPIIDAGILRTCRELYRRGSEMFFTKNKLSFWMPNASSKWSPPTLLPHGNIVYRPNPILPWDCRRWVKIDQALVQIQHQWPLPMLEGFVYYDPFLRYLHTIGPIHAAKMKNLEFEGVIRLHQCEDKNCQADACLMQCLNVYVHFIAKFCRSIEKVEIHTVLDQHFDEPVGEFLHPWGPGTIEETLDHVLEAYVQRIPTLKEFVVYDSFGNRVIDWSLELDGLKRFIENASGGTRWRRDEPVAVAVQDNVQKCGFCKEDHATEECFNLCAFCGRFGHWKRTCMEYWDCWKRDWLEEDPETDNWLKTYPDSDRWPWYFGQ
ncbi:hypothetical protein HYALB_00013220 [Hymenoscyphus albidus]|uniref:CCHC-type domain-containing protein n=1 Tax=Hymenoscyphus albidus TaxID=595503 RepID=A0A9N9LNQ1_9HELO|nr:hypothetical protein HYALB_00013220 [Hymenoscyphus albidus]